MTLEEKACAWLDFQARHVDEIQWLTLRKFGMSDKWCEGMYRKWKAGRYADPRADCMAWDKAADAAGIDPRREFDAAKVLGFPRPFGPRREASSRCESGKHHYCSCDTCF